MIINKEKTVAFAGHRTGKILKSSKNANIIETIIKQLGKTVGLLYEKGYNTFLSGMAEGFDMLAAEAVIRARMKHPNIQLIAVVPFMGQEFDYTPLDQERYRLIFTLANKVVFTSDTYHDGAFFLRNDFLVANSSCLVCYYNEGQRSGTMYTVNRAKAKDISVINLQNLVE